MDEAKVDRVRAAMFTRIGRAIASRNPPTVEGNTGRVQALLLTAATLEAATENAGNDPSMFREMAEAALEAFDDVIRRYRTTRN